MARIDIFVTTRRVNTTTFTAARHSLGNTCCRSRPCCLDENKESASQVVLSVFGKETTHRQASTVGFAQKRSAGNVLRRRAETKAATLGLPRRQGRPVQVSTKPSQSCFQSLHAEAPREGRLAPSPLPKMPSQRANAQPSCFVPFQTVRVKCPVSCVNPVGFS